MERCKQEERNVIFLENKKYGERRKRKKIEGVREKNNEKIEDGERREKKERRKIKKKKSMS